MTETAITFTPGPDRHAELRSAFGRFGTGVTVITAPSPIGPLGFTANSFSSVSLEPALVLWSLALRSRRHDAFVAAPKFCIHVLSADQASIADHFATNGQGFETIDATIDAAGVPVLPDCLARFHCDLHRVHRAGDHSLILGEVTQAFVRDGAGLAFNQGAFGRFQSL